MPLALNFKIIILFGLLASIAPFISYTVSLVCFGLSHITYELKFLDQYYGRKYEKPFVRIIIFFSSLFALATAISIFFGQPFDAIKFAILIVLLTLPILKYQLYWNTPIIFLVGAGIIYFPVLTYLVFAFLHNLTPIFFLRDRLTRKRDTFSIVLCIFIGAPIVVGIFTFLIQNNLGFENFIFSANTQSMLSSHYLVETENLSRLKIAFFSSAVFLQLLHYYFTISILPRLNEVKAEKWLFWKNSNSLFITVVLSSFILATGYMVNFSNVRDYYGILASFHAIIEWPVILLLIKTSVSTSIKGGV